MKQSNNTGRVFVVFMLILAMTVPLFGCAESSKEIERSEVVESDAPNEVSLQQPNEDPGLEEGEELELLSPVQEETTEVAETPDPEFDLAQEEDELSSTQRNSINMLNYMSVLAQKINEEQGNQLFLESAYSSLVNDIYPNAVDIKTQAQITSLMDTINNYRMIEVKRARLEYIYEQNQAQAMRKAIPDPIALLSAVQSGNRLKAAAAVLYMAVDSASSYQSATSQADLQFLKDGWELDDTASAELHSSTKNALSYMLNMVRDYDIPGEYALNQESVESFVQWSEKPDSQLVSKVAWLESHQNTYQWFGPYWLELARDYYASGDYERCLNAIDQYESISTRIFRKDIDFAEILPMAITSAKETMGTLEYVDAAGQFCTRIIENTKDGDWGLRYFAAQTYMDLYALSEDSSYLEAAYKIAFDNVNILVDEQRSSNDAYLADVVKINAEKGATKREKAETKEYNKLLKEERKIALPPVNEALYLNCDLLIALADKLEKPKDEQKRIDAILHENGDNLFLPEVLDNRFRLQDRNPAFDPAEIDVSFNGKKLTIPAAYLSDRYEVSATITGADGTEKMDHWIVAKVKRNGSNDVSAFEVSLISQTGEKYKFKAGDTITFTVVPVAESPGDGFELVFQAVAVKKLLVFNGIDFERIID